MPAPRFLRPVVTRLLDPIALPVAGRLPGFAVLTHTGRRSGKVYRTPVNVFRNGRDYVVALTYGSDAAWVLNVRAAGGCELRTMGRTVRLTDPRLVVDPSRHLVPAPVRLVLGLLRVKEFLILRRP